MSDEKDCNGGSQQDDGQHSSNESSTQESSEKSYQSTDTERMQLETEKAERMTIDDSNKK